MKRKFLKIVMWTNLGLVGLIIAAGVCGHLYLRWKYPEAFLDFEFVNKDYEMVTELYEIPDTIIYGPAPVNVDSGSIIIPFQNLPIRDMSYLEIIESLGKESVVQKGDWYPASSLPYQWSSYPRDVAEKCDSLGEKQVYRVDLAYDDGSDDYLLLWVYEDNNDVQILWGLRANPMEFNIE